MPKEDVELSGKMPAFVSWIQTIGLVLFLLSRLAYREDDWLLYVSVSLILIATFFRLYFDWKAGRKKAFRTRLLMLIGIVVVCLLLVLIFGNRYNN